MALARVAKGWCGGMPVKWTTLAPSAWSAGASTCLPSATVWVWPFAARTVPSPVPSRRVTPPALPVTRSDRALTWETVRPAFSTAALAAAMLSAVGPNRAANCAGVSHLWYEAEPTVC